LTISKILCFPTIFWYNGFIFHCPSS
jgi:hypothetical protein